MIFKSKETLQVRILAEQLDNFVTLGITYATQNLKLRLFSIGQSEFVLVKDIGIAVQDAAAHPRPCHS